MVERGVECLEVVPLGIRLRPPRPGEAQVPEDVPDLVYRLRHRVETAFPRPTTRQSEVLNTARGWTRERALSVLQRVSHDLLDPIGLLAHRGPPFRGHTAQAAQNRRNAPVFAPEVVDPNRLECLRILGTVDRIERFDLQRPQRVLRVLFSHALQLPRKKGGPTVTPRSPLS